MTAVTRRGAAFLAPSSSPHPLLRPSAVRTAFVTRASPVAVHAQPPRRAVIRSDAAASDTDAASTEAPARPDGASGAEPTPPVEREVPFEIRGFSLANVGLGLGTLITVVSFSSYFSSNGQASASSLGFVYGVPILLIGCALKYAELQPVDLASSPAAKAAREAKATECQKKIVSDITRHRYGDEAHLSSTMSALGLVPRGAACPELLSASEVEDADGQYALALQFYSVETPYKQWTEGNRIERMERFFGPNVRVEVEKLDGEKRLVELRIITADPVVDTPVAAE
jgi:Protein of unknown function (DUF2854)